MSSSFRISSRGWMMIPIVACIFIVWNCSVRVNRVEYVTGLAQDELNLDSTSASGYAGGMNKTVLPEPNDSSFHWVAQTQQMFAREEWRLRHVDYDNAPFGREVSVTSPYRWWLGLIAWVDSRVSHRPIGVSVERAVLIADPLFQLFLLAGTAMFVAWRFGSLPAALSSLGLATILPLAGEFLPALPDDQVLSSACAFWSVLLLLAGIEVDAPILGSGKRESGNLSPQETARRRTRWFFSAGVVGALGLWVSVNEQVPVLLGIALGALITAWTARKKTPAGGTGLSEVLPWRAWACGGASATLAAVLMEYYPSHLGSWELRLIHPVYGLSWLGGGELLHGAVVFIQSGKRQWSRRLAARLVLAMASLSALPIALWKTKSFGFLEGDVLSSRLSTLQEGIVADNLWTWLVQAGITPMFWAVVMPLALVPLALWILARPESSGGQRAAIALGLGPVLVGVGFACRELSWWNALDGLLLALLIPMGAALAGMAGLKILRWVSAVVLVSIFSLGAFPIVSASRAQMDPALTGTELNELTQRDLAHWLARRAGQGRAIVLAPLHETSALYYYGGLRGLGTLDWKNVDGFVAAMRIISASTPREAQELINRRGVTHLVIPSWDSQLEEYARLGLGQVEGSFLDRLRHWDLPGWLRPLPYQLPSISGVETPRSVLILEVVEEQDDAAALSRIAEYFVEMDQLDMALASSETLRRFPSNVGAMAARAQVASARGDQTTSAQLVQLIKNRLSGRGDRGLAWDRRVSLAIVLARAGETELARTQIEYCLERIDSEKIRSLTTVSLYRFQVLNKAFGLHIADPQLRELATELIPTEWRKRL